MTSQCSPGRPNLSETKMKRRCDVACHLGNDDRFHEIKLQSIKNERLQQIEAAERFEQQNKKNKKGLK